MRLLMYCPSGLSHQKNMVK